MAPRIQAQHFLVSNIYLKANTITRSFPIPFKYAHIAKSAYTSKTIDPKFLNMSNHTESNGSTARKAILVLSASQYLVGRPISEGIKADWGKEKAQGIAEKFDNVGFQVDPTDAPGMLKAIEETLQTRPWDGVIVGWCLRGHVEFTELFENIIAVLVKQATARPELKIMFSTGPTDLVETTVRNFPV